ncbi:Glycosyl transferase family 2 [compost metagenome]
MASICLCMIVKNESKIIERLLNSVNGTVDYISILDTGSTDDTKELIDSWCKKNLCKDTVSTEKLYKIHNEEFVNFSVSRTRSYQLAKESFPHVDYFLLLDADFIFINDGLDKSKLNHDSYLIEQRTEAISYYNTRLISNRVNWRCVGVTHEYWEIIATEMINIDYIKRNYALMKSVYDTLLNDNTLTIKEKDRIRKSTPKMKSVSVTSSRDKIQTAYISDIGDGGAKGDKFTRDKRLLIEGLDDPNTSTELKTRYRYYLGQTLKDLGEFKEAIEMFKLRVEDGGWQEEVYYSKYQIGNCYKNLRKQDKALLAYLDAWNYRSSRLEALGQAIEILIEKKHYLHAYILCKQGKMNVRTQDVLFVDHKILDHILDYNLSIICYYVGAKTEGRNICEMLIKRSHTLSSDILSKVTANLKWYL